MGHPNAAGFGGLGLAWSADDDVSIGRDRNEFLFVN